METQVTEPLPEPPPAPASRRLTRSSKDRVIAGVAGGLGRYFSIDPVVVRIAFVVGAFFGGAGFIAYAAAWLLVPSDDGAGAEAGARGVAKRLGIFIGAVIVTGVAAFAGFWGAASGSQTVTAIVVIALGGILVVGAFTRGLRWLIVPALAMALGVSAAAAADLDISGGMGERIYRPANAAALRDNYELGVGHLRVDLRDTDLGPGDHTIHLRLGMGQAEVLVPRNVCVSSTASISAGATNVFTRDTGGVYHDWEDSRTAAEGNPHLTVDADIGFGELRIQHDEYGKSIQDGACSNG